MAEFYDPHEVTYIGLLGITECNTLDDQPLGEVGEDPWGLAIDLLLEGKVKWDLPVEEWRAPHA